MSAASPAGGYFFLVDEWRREFGIEERIEIDGTFTEAVSAPDWQNRDAEIVFLSMDGSAIDYVCLGKRGHRNATLKNQIRFTNFFHFDPPIDFDELTEEFTGRLRPHLVRTSQGNGRRVPPATWAELLAIVERMRPASVQALAALMHARQGTARQWTKSSTVVEERDAVNVALRIARMNERELLGWNPGDDADPPEPFLAALNASTSYETPMIEHDASVFGDWAELKKNMRGVNMFQRGGRRLTIFNVNARSIETTLGVDLIYYTARYDSYVLVQYKRMERDPDSGASYRMTDAAYKRELAAMKEFEEGFCESDDDQLRNYRLHAGPFYFKICESDACIVDRTTMVPGMYLPLDYWQRLVAGTTVLVKRGGVRVNRQTAGRHISNDLFVNLVQDGWVGSRTCRSGVITRIIESWLQNDHSLILASCFDSPRLSSSTEKNAI